MNICTKNYLFISFSFLLLFYRINNLTCQIKLTCKENCTSLIKINGLTNANDGLTLNEVSSDIDSNYKQYNDISFTCEPGDKITFTNNAYSSTTSEVKEGGFISKLIITGADNSNKIYEAGDNSNIFSCSPACSIGTEDLTYSSNDETSTIYGYSDATSVSVTVNIPYEITELTASKAFSDINSNPIQFQFSSYYSPAISGAETDGRLKIKITYIPDTTKVKLYKDSVSDSNIINSITEIPLETNLFLEKIDDNYGLFSLTYEVLVMNDAFSASDPCILKFNVCYKYCSTCNAYSSDSPSDYKCTNCVPNSFFIDTTDGTGISTDRCYSSTEISTDFSNYFLNNDGKYYKCDSSCTNCINSYRNCDICSNNYYKIVGVSNASIQCYNVGIIPGNFPHYYFNSDDSKYHECDISCKTCHISSTNCHECFKDEDDISKIYYFIDGQTSPNKHCYNYKDDILTTYSHYYLVDPPTGHTFAQCDNSCETCKLTSTNCFSCNSGYYFYEGQAHKCLSNTAYSNYFLLKDSNTFMKNDESCTTYDSNADNKKNAHRAITFQSFINLGIIVIKWRK